jgi:uncharacterized protein (DUF302 family)
MTQYSRKLKIPFEDVVSRVTQNLTGQGFGVITSIDVQDTFRKQLGLHFRKYKILGACNPLFAYKAVSLEPNAGTMLPCNVVIQEHENGEVEVSAVNPLESIREEDQTPTLKNLSKEVGIRLRAAIDFIQREFKDKFPQTYSHEVTRSGAQL